MRPLGREIPGRSPGTAQGVERRRRHDRMPALLHASLKKKIKKDEYKAQAEITEAQWSYGRVRKSERVQNEDYDFLTEQFVMKTQ